MWRPPGRGVDRLPRSCPIGQNEGMTFNGDLPPLGAPQRVSGMRVPDAWTLPGKPEGLSAAADDAWRQTGFLLGDDLRLLEAGLDVQARFVASGYTPAARTMTMAALASLWSRAFLCSSDAAGLVRRGAYQSAVPLVRQAIEHVAAQSALPGEIESFPGVGAPRLRPPRPGARRGGRARALLQRRGDRGRRAPARHLPRRQRPRPPQLRADRALHRQRGVRASLPPDSSPTRRSISAGPSWCWAGCCASRRARCTSPCTRPGTSPPRASCATRLSRTCGRSNATSIKASAAGSRSTSTRAGGVGTCSRGSVAGRVDASKRILL